jgi:ribosome-associated heat shock protein Hsp15
MKSNKEPATSPARIRLDKWLWAARFYKTRSLAAEETDKGRVLINGAAAKPAREVKPGDELRLRIGVVERTVRVRAISAQRGPAPAAALLYEETAESLASRARLAEQRRLAPEPAQSLPQGRPTKRDRRAAERFRGKPSDGEVSRGAEWGSRWSASLDDE